MASPTQRALAHCRKQGWIAEIVESWNQHSLTRRDLFNFADLLVLGSGGGSPLAVQVTSGSNHASRRAKILSEPRAELWVRSGCRIEVWSFEKKGALGKSKRWEMRTEEIGWTAFEDQIERCDGDDDERDRASYDACRRRCLEHLEAIRSEKAERRRLKREQ